MRGWERRVKPSRTWEKAYDQREQGLTVMKREPMFDPLRSDARFQELLRRMNLPLEAPTAALAYD
jgi:hypothetical protein